MQQPTSAIIVGRRLGSALIQVSAFLLASASVAVAQSSDEQRVTDPSCPVEVREAHKLRLADSTPVYVEPVTFAHATSSWLLAGEPLYLWRRDSLGRPQLDSSRGTFGVELTPRSARPILKPPVRAIVTHARVRADGDRYSVVFTETDGSSIGRRRANVLGFWFAQIERGSWTTLEALPLPAGAELNPDRISPLIHTRDGFLVAFPFHSTRRDHLAVYTRSRAGWRMDTLKVDAVAYATAAHIDGHAHLYIVRPDTTRPPDVNSLSLFSLVDGTWVDRGFIIRGGRTPVHHPAIVHVRDAYFLSWREDNDITGQADARAAVVRPDGAIGQSTALAHNIRDMMPVYGPGDRARWVISTTDSNGQKTLLLIEWNGDEEPLIRDAVEDPFTGPSIAYSSAQGLAIAGPLMSLVPGDEPVTTGILRLASRCSIPVR